MKYIGKSIPRKVGPDIVSGKAKFTADIKLPGMLYGRLMGSPYAHAEIISIDVKKAAMLKGVHAVVTYKDVPADCYVGDRINFPEHAKPLDKTLRFVGDCVACVAAESEDIADEAMSLIEVEYKKLPAVLTMEDALADGAPQIYESIPGNVAPLIFDGINRLNFSSGDTEKALKEADYVSDTWAEIPNFQNALPFEAPVSIAEYTPDGTLYIRAGNASPSQTKSYIVNSLRIPSNKVRVDSPFCGGSFGTKVYGANVQVHLFAALMAKKARRPVLLAMTKEQHLTICINRMRAKSHIRVGINRDASVAGIQIEEYVEAGTFLGSQANMITVGAVAIPFMSKTDNFKFDGKVVMTNRQASGSFRGYGYMEMSDMLSHALLESLCALRIDPVVFFEKNALRHGERFYNNEAIGVDWVTNSSPDWSKMVNAGAEAFDWKNKFKGWRVPIWVSEDGKRVHGVGVGIAGQATAGAFFSNTDVTIDGYGYVVIKTELTEHGTGVRDVLCRIAAEALDIPVERISLGDASTANAPVDMGSFGSRSTNTAGKSTVLACLDLKKKIIGEAERVFGVSAEDLDFKGGEIVSKSNAQTYPLIGIFGAPMNSLTGFGHWNGLHGVSTGSMQFVMVEVDTETGGIKIIEHLSVTDAGCVINPAALKNQMDGFYPGVDVALYEETVYDSRTNRVLNSNMIDYKTRTFNDACDHNVLLLESLKDTDTVYPYGAFGVGETALSPGSQAMSMAVYNACGGIELPSYPLLPGKILAALKKKGDNANEKV
ncbi:MAG: xanthine dehydrogenase family protein molybdopterin-binding subunit [Synergistaceae bacterium]|nr:xanthine dehydrogenase family protein molybdopterin-binding subunit [Synergistaceae bacterium]